ncbi:MAG: hypothetical protein WBM77_09540 [Maribacter sp.]|jgi:hypothetical protein
MRILFFVTVFLCTGLVSFAQDKSPEKLIITTEKDSALTSTKERISLIPQENLASIYKFKNAKIIMALTFATKGDRPKLA